MKVLIFLGNPGPEYKNTRHNLGFLAGDMVAERLGLTWESLFGVLYAKTDQFVLLKPQQFMNVSGSTAKKYLSFFKIKPKDVVVVHDDMDLSVGQVRVRFGGSSGGHHGVESVILAIGEGFWRLRIGIGRDEKIPGDKFVLMEPKEEETGAIKEALEKTVEIVLEYLKGGKLEGRTV